MKLFNTGDWITIILFIILATTNFFAAVDAIGQVIDAVNCGGPEHVDSYGIQYRADPLEGKAGIPSDYGRRFLIGRVDPHDQILYQTERYGLESFDYVTKIPRDVDADYILVMKFSEVYFAAPNQKVFDVILNDEHEVVKDLDIFAKVGRGIAHDEIVPFQVRKGKLRVQEEVSDFNGKLTISLVKGSYDNPKINAFYVMKGTVHDVPPLPPLETPADETEEEEDSVTEPPVKSPFASGPKAQNPYEEQEQSAILLPILIALACFIPALLCLCKL